jgi:pimeloyl-ACP methyl ester carboxylesterase
MVDAHRRRWLTLAAAGCAGAAVRPAFAAAPRLPARKTLTLFGARIRYHELGRQGLGPTLVLLHGLGSSAAGDWGGVMPQLARTHHVLAPDLLGFGRSDKPFIEYGIQLWVDFLGEFLREKEVGEFVLMGESLGGWIAAQYTLQALRGEAVGASFVLPKPSRLVLADAAGLRDGASEAKSENPAPTASAPGPGPSLAKQKALLASIFHAPSFSSEESVRRGMGWSLSKGDSHTIASVLDNPAFANDSLDGRLAGITIPTLVVWGEYDQLIPLAKGRRLAAEIPGARLVVVPDAGHAPMIETPSAFLAALGNFLAP